MAALVLGNYSQKVLNRSEKPSFTGSESDCDEYLLKKDSFFCHFHFPNSNGEITIYGQLAHEGQNHVIRVARFFTNVRGGPLAFLDALVELSHGRDFHSLPLLRMKEIDSYLRDENSQSAFPNEGVELFRYYEVINAYQQALGKNKAYALSSKPDEPKNPPRIEDYRPHSFKVYDREKVGPFQALDADLKVRIVGDALSHYVRPLLRRDGGDVECVHVLENLIVVIFHGNCGTCGMSLTTTMAFIKKLLRTELHDADLDIITDS